MNNGKSPKETGDGVSKGETSNSRLSLLRGSIGWVALLPIRGGLFVLVATAEKGRREPIIEFEANTAIISYSVTGSGDATWNLPTKTVKITKVYDDKPVDEVTSLGVGPFVMPRGTKITIIRLAGQPLNIRIDSIDKARRPFLIDAKVGRTELPLNANIRMAGTISPTGACKSSLPQSAFRAAGTMEVGANISEDAFDEADQLRSISEIDFESRFVQPSLLSGTVTILGRTVFTEEPYSADTLTLRRGDVLQLAANGKSSREAGSFFIEINGCETLFVRGVQIANNAAIRRLGSASSFVKLSIWQMITGDAVVSVVVAIFAGLLGVLRIAIDIGDFRERYQRPQATSTPPRRFDRRGRRKD